MKKLIDFSEHTIKQLNDIKDKRGMKALNEVVRSCISEVHRKEFPAYEKPVKPNQTPEEKAHAKVLEKEASKTAYEKVQKQKALDKLNLVNEYGKYDFLRMSPNSDMINAHDRKGEFYMNFEIPEFNGLSVEWLIEARTKSHGIK